MILQEIRDILSEIDSECIKNYDVFKNQIFQDIDYYSIISLVPLWIREAGNSAECAMSKEIFESLVKENNNVLTNKLLYLYDCEMLTASMQDRFFMISSLVENFYKKMPYESNYKMTDFNSAALSYSYQNSTVFAFLNSIFIFLGSSFDIITKIVTELNHIKAVDYSNYPSMKSNNVQFGDFKGIPLNLKNNTIFERTVIVRKVESIRNRIVHDGSFDFSQIIYTGLIENKNYTEACIMFPDFENNNFISSRNRRNFYVKSDRINLILPDLLKDLLLLINHTLKETNKSFYMDSYRDKDDLIRFKSEISNWTKTTFNILKKNTSS